MQINEVTKPIQEAGPLDSIKAAFTKDPTLAGLPYQQRLAAIERNTQIDQAVKDAVAAWNLYNVQLMKNNQNQPLAQPEFEKLFNLWVDKNLLPSGASRRQLTNANQINQAIRAAVTNRNDPEQFIAAMDIIVNQAAVAQVDPNLVKAGLGISAGKPAAGGAAAATGVNTQQIQQALGQVNVTPKLLQTIGRVTGGTVNNNMQARKTGNPGADALLAAMGFKVS